MQQDRLGEDAADRVPRIKRGHRVLKDHLHATAQRDDFGRRGFKPDAALRAEIAAFDASVTETGNG
jgi:hypothetical protein